MSAAAGSAELVSSAGGRAEGRGSSPRCCVFAQCVSNSYRSCELLGPEKRAMTATGPLSAVVSNDDRNVGVPGSNPGAGRIFAA